MPILTAEPPWLAAAQKDLGVRELPGAANAPVISQWLMDLGAWWRDDETPWCGVACGHWFRSVNLAVPSAFYRAKAWLDWGVPLSGPVLGAVVVFTRDGGGHVGLVAGVHGDYLVVLGGNQGDMVKYALFDRSRVSGYRWPSDTGLLWSSYVDLPPITVASGGLAVSTNEA